MALSRADFTWDAERGLYLCPKGKALRTTRKVLDGRPLAKLRSEPPPCAKPA